MKEKINSISAIWMSTEKISVQECSKRVLGFLLLLNKHNDDIFSNWFEKGGSKKEALKNKVELVDDYFQLSLNRNWDKKFEDLGSRISYWTGNKEESKSAEISFNVGAYGDKSFNKNICVITLPAENEYYDSTSNKEALLKLIVDYWKPDKVLINGEAIGNTFI